MTRNIEMLHTNLNHPQKDVRLQSLKSLKELEAADKIPKPVTGRDVNNHIHTLYSFSPYSPVKALWQGYQAGLCTAGIMDHDSIAGAEEFIEAGKILKMPTTIGLECRVDFSQTPLAGRRINNPDQTSNVYMALHGIPHTQIRRVDDFFKPCREARMDRNRSMTGRIHAMIEPFGLTLDYDRDVVPLSQYPEGGTVTERHILYGFALRLMERYEKGLPLVRFLKEELQLSLHPRIEAYLLEPANVHYAYDLLGALKSDLVARFYIPAQAECPDVRAVLAFSKEIGAISAYAYLGDVGDSVTGDKKTQKYEDDYLEELFSVLKTLGFDAVTYMPSRNTLAQLTRVKDLCSRHCFFQISGEDINAPRQPFICEAQRQEPFRNLYESTWALIGHELCATEGLEQGMFSKSTLQAVPDLEQRIEQYARRGRYLADQ